jgi:deoxyribodipyrimidine photolyase
MDKQAYSEMFGRELATRAFVETETQSIEKSADNGEDVSQDRARRVASLVDDLTYREEQQKLAFQNGAYKMLNEFKTALEEGADRQALAKEAEEAMEEFSKEAMQPENEEEDKEMSGRMVKGAAEAIQQLTGQEMNDDIKQAARDLVANHFS